MPCYHLHVAEFTPEIHLVHVDFKPTTDELSQILALSAVLALLPGDIVRQAVREYYDRISQTDEYKKRFEEQREVHEARMSAVLAEIARQDFRIIEGGE